MNGQVNDLSHYFTWMSVDLSMIMIRRLSTVRLTQYYYVEFLQTAISNDPSNTFFDSNSNTLILKNPLNALPPDQAIRLIDCFFLVHPYSIMFNKTILLQAYWTDTADPLLLSVIYGTALFMSQSLDGKPLNLLDRDNLDKRNPFLEYAHILLSKASSEVTLSRYQAVILLGAFETTFGYAKKGVSLFGSSYMIADQLGLFDHQLPKGLSPIERELLQITFWSFFQCIVRGCVELTRIPHYVLCYRSYDLPPINTSLSLSYQFDIQNGHPKTFKDYHYLVESFYVQSVISKYACKYACIIQKPADNIEQEINGVIKEFHDFIKLHRHTFSDLQGFTFDLHHSLFAICFRFLKTKKKKHLDLNDAESIQKIDQVLPEAVSIVDKMLCFLSNHPFIEPSLLPRALMTSIVDIVSKILIHHYTLQPTPIVLQSLETLDIILSHTTIWEHWDSAAILKPSIVEFLKKHRDNSLSLMPLNLFDPSILLQEADLFNICGIIDWSTINFDPFASNFMP
ncbi:hypothetical protein G6F37_003851 [Rhizopus arrhizus]|nr:hypothetical protein G6F38_002936 [Rhizopus arrhizus]KAG1160585.1 hypothetical protein G6F37_003851 [Rhizopus arrhizus]